MTLTLNNKNLIWIDLEMTGLNLEQDRIIEIATVVTDSDLKIISEGPVIAIHQLEQQLSLMDDWNFKTHTQSGLINRVRVSNYDERSAESATIAFLTRWVPVGVSPICGNSVTQDRRFLFKYMPKLEKYFHYHCLDVSTLTELVHRWKPNILVDFKKNKAHQASADILESIAELSYYRNHFIQS